jgi:hypothetical protein
MDRWAVSSASSLVGRHLHTHQGFVLLLPWPSAGEHDINVQIPKNQYQDLQVLDTIQPSYFVVPSVAFSQKIHGAVAGPVHNDGLRMRGFGDKQGVGISAVVSYGCETDSAGFVVEKARESVDRMARPLSGGPWSGRVIDYRKLSLAQCHVQCSVAASNNIHTSFIHLVAD